MLQFFQFEHDNLLLLFQFNSIYIQRFILEIFLFHQDFYLLIQLLIEFTRQHQDLQFILQNVSKNEDKILKDQT